MRLKSLSTRLIAWVLGATLTVSTVTFYAEFVENRQKLKEDASKTAEFAARALANDISALIRGIEQATRTLGSVVRHVRPDPDQTRALLHSLIEADEAIYGAAIAYAPEAFIAGTDFAAYMHRTQDGMRYLDIVSQDPGFRNDPWYRVPSLTGKASWSEPLPDETVRLQAHAALKALTGTFIATTVADVEASVEAGVELVRQEGLLIRQVVQPLLFHQDERRRH